MVAKGKVYDATTSATLDTGSAALVDALVPGDDVRLDASRATAAFGGKDAGTGIAVTVSGFGTAGTDAGDYVLTQPTGLTADIAPAPLTVTANDVPVTYGEPLPPLTARFSGFVRGAKSAAVLSTQPILTTTAPAGNPSGVYAIDVSGAAGATISSHTCRAR